MQTLSTPPRLALHRPASPGCGGASVGVCPWSSRWLSYLEIPRPKGCANAPLEHSKAITESAYIHASLRLSRVLCKEWPRKARIAYAARVRLKGIRCCATAYKASYPPSRGGEPQQRNGRTRTIKRGTAPRAGGVVLRTPAVAWHRAWRKARRGPRA